MPKKPNYDTIRWVVTQYGEIAMSAGCPLSVSMGANGRYYAWADYQLVGSGGTLEEAKRLAEKSAKRVAASLWRNP